MLSLMPYAEPSSPCITKRAGMSPICTPCFGAVTSRSLPEEAPAPPPWMPAAYLRRYCVYLRIRAGRRLPRRDPDPRTRMVRPRRAPPPAGPRPCLTRCFAGRPPPLPGGCVRPCVPGPSVQVERTLTDTEKSSWDLGQVRLEVCRGGRQRLAKTGCGRWCRATPLKGDALAGEPGAGKGHCPSGRGGRELPGRAREVQVAATRRSY